jgi:5-methyltetrahydrofolate--homocysteine methyltransferase
MFSECILTGGNAMAGKLAKLLMDLKEQEALEFVEKALTKGADPMQLLGDAREGMSLVGQKFASGEYFIPDLIYSGEILKGVVKRLEPQLKKEKEEKRRGKVVIGTVAGDIHDIGKNLVSFMLDVNGFELLDLGINVPIQNFVDTVKQSGSKVVGLSGFLTLAFDSMKATVKAIKDAGMGDLKIMIGGGQIDEQVRMYTGADAYGKDAMAAVKLAGGWIGG